MTAKTKIFRSMQALVLGAALTVAVAGPAGADESVQSKALPLSEQVRGRVEHMKQRAFNLRYPCGETFITVQDTDSAVWTIRKANVTKVFWPKWPKSENFTITMTEGYNQMMGPQSIEIKVKSVFAQSVILCLN